MENREYINAEDAELARVAGAVQIATASNLLDTKYEFYGFNDDLRDTIN